MGFSVAHRTLSVLGSLREGPASVERLLDALKTKRYTRSKLQRMLVRILLDQPRHPVITRDGRDNAALLSEDIRATTVYALAFREPDAWQLHRDYNQAPIMAGG